MGNCQIPSAAVPVEANTALQLPPQAYSCSSTEADMYMLQAACWDPWESDSRVLRSRVASVHEHDIRGNHSSMPMCLNTAVHQAHVSTVN